MFGNIDEIHDRNAQTFETYAGSGSIPMGLSSQQEQPRQPPTWHPLTYSLEKSIWSPLELRPSISAVQSHTQPAFEDRRTLYKPVTPPTKPISIRKVPVKTPYAQMASRGVRVPNVSSKQLKASRPRKRSTPPACTRSSVDELTANFGGLLGKELGKDKVTDKQKEWIVEMVADSVEKAFKSKFVEAPKFTGEYKLRLGARSIDDLLKLTDVIKALDQHPELTVLQISKAWTRKRKTTKIGLILFLAFKDLAQLELAEHICRTKSESFRTKIITGSKTKRTSL